MKYKGYYDLYIAFFFFCIIHFLEFNTTGQINKVFNNVIIKINI